MFMFSLDAPACSTLCNSRIIDTYRTSVGNVWCTSLTVTTRSEVTSAPLRMFTAGPLMDAQVGYSHDSGSYLQISNNIVVTKLMCCNEGSKAGKLQSLSPFND